MIEVGAELVSVSGMWDVLANLDGILSGLLSEGGLGTCSFRSVRLQEGRRADGLRARLSRQTEFLAQSQSALALALIPPIRSVRSVLATARCAFVCLQVLPRRRK